MTGPRRAGSYGRVSSRRAHRRAAPVRRLRRAARRLLRARLDRRPAGRTAHPGAGRGVPRRRRARRGRDRRRGAHARRHRHRRARRDQRGDGRLQARVHARRRWRRSAPTSTRRRNCHCTTGTLSGAAQVVIVNGPVRTEIDVNCRAGCFGPGWRANATIGRALAARDPQRVPCHPELPRPGDVLDPRPLLVLLRRGRGRQPVDADERRARLAPEGTSAVTVASAMTMAAAARPHEPHARRASLDTIVAHAPAARHRQRRVAGRRHQRASS